MRTCDRSPTELSPGGYPMTRRIERAMALLRRRDLSVTEICFAVGCVSRNR
jgi:transcriptional regulator GlxA family with amidase domain